MDIIYQALFASKTYSIIFSKIRTIVHHEKYFKNIFRFDKTAKLNSFYNFQNCQAKFLSLFTQYFRKHTQFYLVVELIYAWSGG